MKTINKEKILFIIIILSILVRLVGGLIVLNEIPKRYGWYPIAKNVIAGEKTLLEVNYAVNHGHENIVSHFYLVRSPLYVFLYVVFIKVFKESVILYLIVHSIISAISIYLTYQLFNKFVSIQVTMIGAAFVGFYPYFVSRVWNATEDNLFILFILLSLYMIFRYFDLIAEKYLVLSAIGLGLTYLVRNTILIFVVLLMPIIIIYSYSNKILRVAIFYLTFFITISPWIMYAYSIYGKITLSDYNGSKLWSANNKYICSLYPKTSIDRIESKMWSNLTHRDYFILIKKGQLDRDKYFFNEFKSYVCNNPISFAKCGIKKVICAFSLAYNPSSSEKNMTLRNLVHVVSYVPLLIIGSIGMLFCGKKYITKSLIFLAFFLSLLIMSFLTWSHTRHTIPYHLTYLYGLLIFLEHKKDCRLLKWLKE